MWIPLPAKIDNKGRAIVRKSRDPPNVPSMPPTEVAPLPFIISLLDDSPDFFGIWNTITWAG